jgi:hypothetical protein
MVSYSARGMTSLTTALYTSEGLSDFDHVLEIIHMVYFESL